MCELTIQEVLELIRRGKWKTRQVSTSVYEVYDEEDNLVGYIECPDYAQSPEECEFKPK